MKINTFLISLAICLIKNGNSEENVRELRYRDYSPFRGRNVTQPIVRPPYPEPPFIDYPEYLEEEQTLPPPP